ncbi:GNAT family N-acetyltransferase [Devosia nitrariae]|uniref:Acetyltransferase n=1 Tax=Devosia nitrariae TaxID=2071872 RepID=A0ABQ5VZH7_9HYPH|nr:GNAT family N-acetyltransferase [Devosia nitrariae]GLQ52853.1 acetyltransferase [Devosia nitrariae]
MTTLVFRDATPADIPAILAICDAGAAEGPRDVDPSTYTDPRYRAAFDAIAADPNHRLVAVESEGEVIATLQLSFLPGLSRLGMWRCVLENVHVRADRRGGGIGSKMVTWAIEEARARGAGMMQLTSNKVRTNAHRFYRALGFEQSHEGFKLML